MIKVKRCHYCGLHFNLAERACPHCLTPRPVIFATLSELSAGEVQFGAAIRIATKSLLKGDIGGFAFTDAMFKAVRDGIRDAFLEGAKMAGFSPDELGPAEERAIQDMTNAVLQRVLSLQADILKRRDKIFLRPEDVEKEYQQLRNRLSLWDARYEQTRSAALAMMARDQKLEWVMDPRKEHCASCMKLDGKVKRASWWRANGILPQVPGAWYLI